MFGRLGNMRDDSENIILADVPIYLVMVTNILYTACILS